MTKQTRRLFSPEYKEQSVARLSEPDATHSSVAAELCVTPTQLKTWRLELEAAGSAAARAAQKAEAVDRRDRRACFAKYFVRHAVDRRLGSLFCIPRQVASHIFWVELIQAMQATPSVPRDTDPAAVDTHFRNVGSQVNIGLHVGGTQFVRDETRSIFVEAADHPVYLFNRVERLGRD